MKAANDAIRTFSNVIFFINQIIELKEKKRWQFKFGNLLCNSFDRFYNNLKPHTCTFSFSFVIPNTAHFRFALK